MSNNKDKNPKKSSKSKLLGGQLSLRCPPEMREQAIKIAEKLNLNEGDVWRMAMSMLLDAGIPTAVNRIKDGRWGTVKPDPAEIARYLSKPLAQYVHAEVTRIQQAMETKEGSG